MALYSITSPKNFAQVAQAGPNVAPRHSPPPTPVTGAALLGTRQNRLDCTMPSGVPTEADAPATTSLAERRSAHPELELIRARIARLSDGVWQPSADWFETDDDLVLVIDAPGIDPASLSLEHDGQEITVAASREANPFGQTIVSERPKGSFQRHLRIPEPVEPNSAAAQYRLGQIEVRFRKLGQTITVVVEHIE
jgi:HSP20 family protein